MIDPTELLIHIANYFDTEAPFLNLDFSITDDIVSSKMYYKQDDLNFQIVKFPFRG